MLGAVLVRAIDKHNFPLDDRRHEFRREHSGTSKYRPRQNAYNTVQYKHKGVLLQVPSTKPIPAGLVDDRNPQQLSRFRLGSKCGSVQYTLLIGW